MQFSRLVDLGIEVAERTASSEEQPFVIHMKQMRDEHFWPGRGVEIEEDFPEILERKFWSRVFYDTSRAIFERTVGFHDHSFWQAQAIQQAHATGALFEVSVRDEEPLWSADTLDRRQFDEYYNGLKD